MGLWFRRNDTEDMMRIFGKIEEGNMCLSDIGEIVKNYWQEIPKHFDNVRPTTTNTPSPTTTRKDALHGRLSSTPSLSSTLSLSPKAQTPKLGVYTGEQVQRKWKPGSLGVVINQYKRICTLEIRKKNPYFAWHSRFHDRIIRTEEELYNIRKYIKDNSIKLQEKLQNYK
jgi:putative transposase